jgi:hypothetical protein
MTKSEKAARKSAAAARLAEFLATDPLIHIVHMSATRDTNGNIRDKIRMYSISQQARLTKLVSDALEMRYFAGIDGVALHSWESWDSLARVLAAATGVEEVRLTVM